MAGCTFSYTPIEPAIASTKITAWTQGCTGDWLKVRFKNGKQWRDKETGIDEFPVCAVMATYVEPCCPDNKWDDRCKVPEHLKFADMASVERRGDDTQFLRCEKFKFH